MAGGPWLGARAIEVQLVSRLTTDQLVYRLPSDLSLQIPKRKVDDGNNGNGKTLASVEHRSTVHLLEEVIRVSWVRSDQEPLKMLVHQPACGGPFTKVSIIIKFLRSFWTCLRNQWRIRLCRLSLQFPRRRNQAR